MILTERQEQEIATAIKKSFDCFTATPPFSDEARSNFAEMTLVEITGKNPGFFL